LNTKGKESGGGGELVVEVARAGGSVGDEEEKRN